MPADQTVARQQLRTRNSISLAAIMLLTIAESVLNLAIVPHGVHIVLTHPGAIISSEAGNMSLTIANIAIGIGVFAIVSMAGVVHLAKQVTRSNAGLAWAGSIALVAMYQLNACQAIEELVQQAQPTGAMAAAAYTDLRPPAIAIALISIGFLGWVMRSLRDRSNFV